MTGHSSHCGQSPQHRSVGYPSSMPRERARPQAKELERLVPAETEPTPRSDLARSILRLQELAGNGAVTALLQSAAAPMAADGIMVGAANDQAEGSADRVADIAMRRLGALPHHVAGAAPPAEHPAARRATDPTGTGVIGPEGGPAGPDVTRALRRRRGAGASLDTALRAQFEPALGADLGSVRIHTGSEPDALSRQLSARAFTYGNDIYFGRGQFRPGSAAGQHVLAHELAHTLQSPSVRRRLWDAKSFHKHTDAGTLSKRGSNVKEMERILVAYEALTKSQDPKPGPDMDRALDLIDNLIQNIDLWLDDHENDKSRLKKQGLAITVLRGIAEQEKDKLETQRLAAVALSTMTGKNAFKDKMEGSASSILAKLAPVVAAAVPSPGDSAEITVAVKIPVWSPPEVYVGGRLTITVDRVIDRKADATRMVKGKDKQGTTAQAAVSTTAITFEAAFTSGVKVGPADIGVEIGGYLEAQGKSPEHALGLISWGWYRTLRESPIIAREVPNLMFGGSTGSVGWKRAERWSSNVQKANFEGQEIAKNAGVGSEATGDAYVRAGLFGAAHAEAKLASVGGIGAGIEASAKFGGGTHWSKDTIEGRGKGVGDKEKEGLRGHTEKLGQKFMTLDLSAGAAGGPFGGSIDASLEFMHDRDANKFRVTYFQAWVNATAAIPMNSTLSDQVLTAVKDFAPRVVETLKKLGMKLKDKDNSAGREMAGEAAIWGEDIISGVGNLTGATGAEDLESVTDQATFSEGETAFVVGGKPGETKTHGVEPEEQDVEVESEADLTLSAGFGLQFEYDSATKKTKVKGVNIDVGLYHNKSIEINADVVGVSVSRGHRILRFQYERGRTTPGGKKDTVWLD